MSSADVRAWVKQWYISDNMRVHTRKKKIWKSFNHDDSDIDWICMKRLKAIIWVPMYNYTFFFTTQRTGHEDGLREDDRVCPEMYFDTTNDSSRSFPNYYFIIWIGNKFLFSALSVATFTTSICRFIIIS